MCALVHVYVSKLRARWQLLRLAKTVETPQVAGGGGEGCISKLGTKSKKGMLSKKGCQVVFKCGHQNIITCSVMSKGIPAGTSFSSLIQGLVIKSNTNRQTYPHDYCMLTLTDGAKIRSSQQA